MLKRAASLLRAGLFLGFSVATLGSWADDTAPSMGEPLSPAQVAALREAGVAA